MTVAVLSLLIGVVLAGAGGELFLRGVLGRGVALILIYALTISLLGVFAG